MTNLVKLSDDASGAEAEILVDVGFNCFRWTANVAGAPRDLLWAHPEFAGGKERGSSSGIPLLFPIVGRITDARFEFGGAEYRQTVKDAFGNALHGFVHDRPWRLESSDRSSATAVFQGSVDAPETLSEWPSDYHLRARYELQGNRLLCTIVLTNPGDKVLPWALGTHAYFRLPLAQGSDPEETLLSVPCADEWMLNDRMQPTGERRTITPGKFEKRKLSGQTFDSVYAIEPNDEDGHITRITDPASGVTIVQKFDAWFGCCVIYTPPHREAICIEPYTSTPDPYRLEAMGLPTGLRTLAPGATFTTVIELEATQE